MSALLRCISWVLCLLPESWCAWGSRIAGFLWHHVFRYRSRIIRENLRQAFPDRSDADREKLARAACVHLVRALFDFLRIPRYLKIGMENVVRIEGYDNWKQAKEKGKGVLILTGHLGSWELGAGGVAERIRKLCLVVKPFTPSVDRFVNHLRRSTGIEVIHERGGMKAILRMLKAGESVAFVVDQNATRKLGIFVDFFGRAASTMAGAAVIAARTKATVVPVSIYRNDDDQRVLEFHEPLPLVTRATQAETVHHMTCVYTRFIEEAIRAHPPEWLWTHRRWKTRPREPGADQ